MTLLLDVNLLLSKQNLFRMEQIVQILKLSTTKLLYCVFSVVLLSSNSCLAATKTFRMNEPAFVSADFVEYNAAESFIYAKGNVTITSENYLLTANTLLYDIENDLLWASGNVRVNDEKNNLVVGESVFFKDKLKVGVISDFILRFADSTLLASKLAERISKDQTNLHISTFTPCNITCGKSPIWQISAKKTHIDFAKEKMVYNNVFFEVYGKPIFFLPYFAHPMPGAEAQSGILIPQIKRSSLGIPIYFRAKPNVDFTLTPRISSKTTLFEIEGRHKIYNGDYIVETSYGEVEYNNKKINSGYIFSRGNFYKYDYRYGFNLNRVSDKAYLKNYYGKYDSYLTSKIYLNKVKDYDYFNLDGFQFQGLKASDSETTDPLILPAIKTKNVISLSNYEATDFIVETNALIYNQRDTQSITRSSVGMSLVNNYITSTGQLLTFRVHDRGDLYLISKKHDRQKYEKTITRNIPEIQTLLRHPFINRISDKSNITVEPLISATIGRKFKAKYNDIAGIDRAKYEISEDNLFSSNRYSGIDQHEYGNRLSYGVNSSLLNGENYFSIFLGQFLHKHNVPSNDNVGNIGKVSLNFSDQLELFYRFRKNKHFHRIREEFGSNFTYNKLELTTSFINLENLKKYYTLENDVIQKNRATQAYYNIGYQLTNQWYIGNEMRVDLSRNKPQTFYRSIKVTYLNDCVSMTLKFYEDYTADPTRGIRKVSGKTITLGLKILNM